MKLQGRIVLPNMFLRAVNAELQMYSIACEGHSLATGHLTKQDKNPNIFENYSDLLKVLFFPPICSICSLFLWKAESHFLWN